MQSRTEETIHSSPSLSLPIRIRIRPFWQPSDVHSLNQIYYEGILTKNATFESKALDPIWKLWDTKYLPSCRFIAEAEELFPSQIHEGEEIVGWAALTPTSVREVYCGVAEVSIYIASYYQGKGIGSQLLQRLIQASESSPSSSLTSPSSVTLPPYSSSTSTSETPRTSTSPPFWTLQAIIFPENVGSILLHQKYGFRVVGERERIGKMRLTSFDMQRLFKTKRPAKEEEEVEVWRNTVLLERRSEAVGL